MPAPRLVLSTLPVGCMLVSAGLPSVSFADESPATQGPTHTFTHQDQAQWGNKRLEHWRNLPHRPGQKTESLFTVAPCRTHVRWGV